MKYLIIIAITSFCCNFISAQSVGIGTTTPNPSAALEITSVTQGILVPRMSTAQRTAISSPATGLLVYDMTSNSFWFRSSTQWVELIDTSNTVVHKNGTDIYMGMIGNVGIGTATPTSKLVVKTAAGSPGIRHTDGVVTLQTNTTASAGVINTTTNHSLQLNASNGTNHFTITPAGNVGIGATAPSEKLSVSGNANFSGNLTLGGGLVAGAGIAVGGTIGFVHSNGDVSMGSKLDLNFSKITTFSNHPMQLSANDLVNQLTLATNGDVGVGTDLPSAKFDVKIPSDVFGAQFGDDIIKTGIKVGSGIGKFGTVTAHPLQLSANNLANQLTLATNGNVGIGMSTPTASLEVARGTGINGTAVFRGSTHFSHFNYSTDEHTVIRGGKLNSHVILNDIAGLGNIGIGTETPLQKLHVEGSSYISQNLGVGMSTPNAQLQLANTIANRKIVLWEAFNNDHEYYGLGINSNTLRYQVQGQTDRHVFYAGSSSITSNELMRIQGNGNVGIGNGAPTERLNIGSFGTPANAYMEVGTSGGSQYKAGIKLKHYNEGWGWTLESDETQAKFFIRRHIDDITGINALTVNGYSGSVGIGTSSPNAPLQFANASQNRKIVMYENANNDHQFNGLGASQSSMRYQTGNIEFDHIFYAATSPTTSNELMRVRGNGDVDVSGKVMMGHSVEQGTTVINFGVTTELTCNCPANTKVLGGGWYGEYLDTISSRPNASGTAWSAKSTNIDPLIIPHVLTVYAICARMGN